MKLTSMKGGELYLYGYIYITTNLVNGKRYIGQHKAKKFTEDYKGSGKILRMAVLKYGYINFKVEMLEECNSSEDMNEKEKYWIKYYNAVDSEEFYNISAGGNSPILYGDKWRECHPPRSEEHCKHISETRIALGLAKGNNNPMYGRKGENCPHYGKVAITNGTITRYVFPEEIENYSEYEIGKDKDYNRRLKLSCSDKYYYNNIEFIGSYGLRDYLKQNGYPKISQNTIYKLADDINVRGYDSLIGKIIRVRFKDKKGR